MNASDDPTLRIFTMPGLKDRVVQSPARPDNLHTDPYVADVNRLRHRNRCRAALKGLALGMGVALVAAVGIVATQAERFKAISDAYVYGYPLVMMDLTRDNFTRTIAPANTLLHARILPPAEFRDVVRPNQDTLYSTAWLDLADGPLVFGFPAMERFHVMQFLDGWTNVFASVGSRTQGESGGDFMVAGPDWHGEVPDGVTLLRAPTNMVWLLGRIATHGEEDYPAVHALQDRFSLTPLENWLGGERDEGIVYQPPVNTLPAPLERMQALTPVEFFTRLQQLMLDNPPDDRDDRAVATLSSIGVDTGVPDAGMAHLPRTPDAWTRGLMTLAFSAVDRRMEAALDNPPGVQEGWQMAPVHIGKYGDDYALRAVVARVGIGANLAADAVYPNANVDINGEALDGSRQYVLRFASGETPPVSGFWSVTVYDRDGFLVPNPRGRHALGDRDALVREPDGSLTLYLQASMPEGDAVANWLPIPAEGPFSVTARMYWPDAALINGSWRLPGLEPVRK